MGWRMSSEGTGVSSNLLSLAIGNYLTYLLHPCYHLRWCSLKMPHSKVITTDDNLQML